MAENGAATHFLDMIRGPRDVKHLNKRQLLHLSDEIRKRIVDVTAQNGGHLGAGLGTVELTIALHYIFDSPLDKIVWDTGHQAYPHKLLTGRNKDFHTLRKFRGIGPFLKRAESEHDHFGAGHASTSISAALGMAKARDIMGKNHHVIAVIGDGSLTGGMAFEALNNAGASKTRIIVILNDNKMSISPNVGALSNYLAGLVADPRYHEKKQKLEHLLKVMPMVGEMAAGAAHTLEENLRAMVSTGMLFKELGFNYYGPIDGHNLDDLVAALRNVRQIDGPVLLHIKTQKGQGLDDPDKVAEAYHAAKPKGAKPGNAEPPKYQDVFADTLIALAKDDPRIVGITAAMPSGTGIDKFQQAFSQRTFDVGIAEQHAVTFAAGLAAEGLKPVCAIYSTFLQRAFDQIIHDVCIQNLGVVFALDRAGLVGEDGPTHHGAFDLSYLRLIPNMTVMVPKDEQELADMLATAVAHNGPIALRYPRGSGLGVARRKPMALAIGKAEVIRRGMDLAFVGVGPLIALAEAAAHELKKEGISAAVINARFVKPLDSATILSFADKVKGIITLEENTCRAGFHSAVLELLAEHKMLVPCQALALPDAFVEHGDMRSLYHAVGFSVGSIVDKAREMMK